MSFERQSEHDEPIFDPMTTVPYLMDVHGLSIAEAYQLAQRNSEDLCE
jgi:hypothetical protein